MALLVFKTPVSSIITDNRILTVDCNTVDFYNQGTTTVEVSGRIVLPLQGFTIAGYPGEINITSYNIVFPAGSKAIGNNLCVTYKIYSGETR